MNEQETNVFKVFIKKIAIFLNVNPIPILKNFGWLTGSQVVVVISSFILSIAFANLLLPETYGIYRYLISIANIMAISSLGGMNISFAASVAKGKEGDLNAVMKSKLLAGILGTLGGLLIAAYYIWRQNTILGYALIIVSLLAPITDALLIYTSILQGKKDFKKISQYSASSQFVFAVSMLATVYFKGSLYMIISVYFVSLLVSRFIAFKLTTSNFDLNKEKDPDTLGKGFHLSLNSIITTIAANIDKLIIFTYLGTVELAVYSIATIPVDHVRGIFKNLSTITLPNYATQATAEIKKKMYRKIFILVLMCIGIMLLYIILVPFVFPIIFPKYSASIPLTMISAFSILAIPALLPNTLLQTKASNTTYYVYNLLSSLMQIILLFIGAYYFKLIGVIVARTIGQLGLFAISIYYARKTS